MSLFDLPNEMLALIGTFCQTGQLGSLSLVSRHFHAVYNPCLYKHNILHDKPSKASVLWAAKKGSLDTLKLAFSYGADLNYTGASSEDVIWKYAKGQEWLYDECSERLGKMYAAPLHLAVFHKHEHIVKWLLESGARVDIPLVQLCGCSHPRRAPEYLMMPSRSYSPTGRYYIPPWYPLHHAISHGANESILSLLVKHGARYAMKDFPGINSALLGLVKPAIDAILKQGNLDPSWEGDDGATALHLLNEGEAFYHHLKLEQRCDKVLTTIKGLADQGVPMNATAHGETVFREMLGKSNLLCAIELLKAGADASDELHASRNEPGVINQMFTTRYKCRINGEKRKGNSQLANALINDQRKALKLAIKRGADVNRVVEADDKLFTRPLYDVLLFSGDFKCVKMMLDAGARIEDAFVDNRFDTGGLLHAFFDGQNGYLRYRYNEEKPVDETDLEPFKRSLKLLLKRGARIDAPSQLRNSALIEVCNRATRVVCDSQYQLQHLEAYYDRAVHVKGDPFFELEFLVKHATSQNVSAEYVKVLMRRNKNEGKVQDLLKQLHSKLLSGIGQDKDDNEEDEDEDDDHEENEEEPDIRSCSVCNPVRP
ncbi:uncharacterized protein FIESC28_00627 [Fusarium coffeatum]|uniref:F-box domain-containing protein n=1 Tax=Fusarium coffeatum TaxID=231269 RepID=A0A366SD28_9HYPO|nr:uncharacterized protein FIESC28_00627 [Fusarium coffeatum]RBR26630.1 hypothetical protein FIESC28_00627 [Fusarium coffeatum]